MVHLRYVLFMFFGIIFLSAGAEQSNTVQLDAQKYPIFAVMFEYWPKLCKKFEGQDCHFIEQKLVQKIEVLLAKGACPDEVFPTDKGNSIDKVMHKDMTALMAASMFGIKPLVEALIKHGANATLVSACGFSALDLIRSVILGIESYGMKFDQKVFDDIKSILRKNNCPELGDEAFLKRMKELAQNRETA